jgi:hypothetical protein
MDDRDFSHSSWYADRYASAAESQKKYKFHKNFAARKSKAVERGQTRKENNEITIIGIGLEYRVINKYTWLVTIDNKEIYFYPGTNRWRPKGGKTTYYSRGIADMVGKVLNYSATYNKDRYK